MRPHVFARAWFAVVVALWLAGPAHAADPNAIVEGEADKALRAEIVDAVGEARRPPQSRLEARARARRAAEDATALLRSEGYYLGEVTPSVGQGAAPRALIRVAPGPRFVFTPTQIVWSGPAPGAAAISAAAAAGALRAGAPGRAADVLAAEAGAVSALRKLGYADAQALPRRVIVDDQAHTVSPTLVIAAGSPVRLGAVQTHTNGRTRAAFVQALAPWKVGDAYDPAKLAELERRLTSTGAFDSVIADLGPVGHDANQPRPVIVTLVERPPHSVELGGGYSSSEGSGVEGKYAIYNRLGRADSVTVTARLFDIQQKLDLELDLPAFGRADQTSRTGADLLADNTKAYVDSGGGLRESLERRFSETSFVSAGVALDYASTSQKEAINAQGTPVGERLKLLIASVPANLVLDRSNDPLDPTRGWRLQATLEPAVITGDRRLAYVKTETQISGYLPLDRGEATVVAARLRVGDLWGGRIPDVPADRRFFAGGGGSVRGYAYQDVGPRLADNTPEGGLSLVETSLEIRRRLNDRFGLVGFVDAGNVGMKATPTFQGLETGAGLGLRYNLGFAPLRVDVATPLNPRRGDGPIQVYLSIGQSF
ncbi:MAG TPA: autotransporter assembly complex family protein [Caulobacteraceae bacterium]|nr:autotransporter assembly complex family protein [Caulobacteraceae bacterium]